MKLRNKKTGEIVDYKELLTDLLSRDYDYFNSKLHEIQDDWEDYYEEPKEYWFIDEYGMVQQEIDYHYDENKSAVHDKRLEIGNYFETKEEAELAVHKLKAWKRLKDKGFEFTGLSNESIGYEIKELSGDFALDLDLLFNGGEE